MKKKLCLTIIFYLACLTVSFYALSGGIFYGFQIDIPNEEVPLGNCPLEYHCGGFYAYQVSPGLQRFGWFINTMLSSIPPAENVYGSLNAGVFLGQELKLGPVFAAANLLAGPGLSVSDLGPTSGSLQLFAEIQLELGIYPAAWMQIGLFGSLQGFGNLIPFKPFEHYALYAPILGLKLNWTS